MRFRDAIPVLALAVSIARSAAAQGPDSAQAAQARAMLEQIARDRPPQAEAAARELLQRLQLQRASLDSLRQKSMAEYWGEVAQLTVQREMLVHQQDSLRQNLMAQLFGTEARARALQRDYRELNDSRSGGGRPIVVVDGVPISDTAQAAGERVIRERLQVLMLRHFAAEDSLRLVQIRAETDRRRRDRAELVRQQVEQILRDATRPPPD